MARFPYYRRLSRRDKATYRESDAVTRVLLPDPGALRPACPAIQRALRGADQAGLQRACQALATALTRQLHTARPRVRVLARRPSDADSELHGLYEHEDGHTPLIRVWMRTSARREVVAYRTFLRTLLHELLHHLDYAHFGLEESFHTEGFFRRESDLMRQLAPRARAVQLSLLDGD